MPTSKKIFSINSYPKISDDHFYAFIPIFTFISKLLSGRKPPLSCTPGAVFNHLPLLLHIYLHFFSENSLVGCPLAGCPGPSHPPAPPFASHCSEERRVGK